MKVNFPKQISDRIAVLSVGAWSCAFGLSSCKLPAKDHVYAQADWTVQTSVTKDEYPVGVSLEEVSNAPLPSTEGLASGGGEPPQLPVGNDTLEMPADEAPLPNPNSAAPAVRTESSLLANVPEPTLPMLPSPTSGTQNVEVRPAVLHASPENHALMAAQTVRPGQPPRGARSSLPGAAEAETTAPTVMATASATPPTETAGSDQLTEILRLARQVETRRTRR